MDFVPDIKDLESRKSYRNSWYACSDGFEPVLKKLRGGNIPEDENHRLINISSGKYVYLCDVDGYRFAYKTQQGKAPLRYMFRPSLPLRECRHYQILHELGIPSPRVLAVGDTRKNFIIKESFIITAFMDNTSDGRVFMPGGKFRNGYEALCRSFCEKNMLMLAKLHDAGYFHKAAHPRNFLFRGDSPENMEIFWIDVARMRKMSAPEDNVIKDLHSFFRDMRLSKDEVLHLIGFYLNSSSCPRFADTNELFNKLLKFKKDNGKKFFPVFDGQSIK